MGFSILVDGGHRSFHYARLDGIRVAGGPPAAPAESISILHLVSRSSVINWMISG